MFGVYFDGFSATEKNVPNKYDDETRIEMACEWIQSLCEADFDKVTDIMNGIHLSNSHCCLGVARRVCNPTGRYSHLSPTSLEADEEKALGLKSGAAHRLATMNDGGVDTPPMTHLEIVHSMLSHPASFFTPKIADGIKEHFFG